MSRRRPRRPHAAAHRGRRRGRARARRRRRGVQPLARSAALVERDALARGHRRRRSCPRSRSATGGSSPPRAPDDGQRRQPGLGVRGPARARGAARAGRGRRGRRARSPAGRTRSLDVGEGTPPLRAAGRAGRRAVRDGRRRRSRSIRTSETARTALIGSLVLAASSCSARSRCCALDARQAFLPVSRMTEDAAELERARPRPALRPRRAVRRADAARLDARRAAGADRGEPPPRAALHRRALARAAHAARAGEEARRS